MPILFLRDIHLTFGGTPLLEGAELALEPGDYVILASDGIHAINTDEIARLVTAFGSDGPDAVADALMREVDRMKDPGQDNVTVLVTRLKPEG